jgi:pepF/M3 family oligoendopeptidase
MYLVPAWYNASSLDEMWIDYRRRILSMAIVQSLPHWDLTTVFPSLESTEFARAFQDFHTQIEALEHTFDAQGVQAQHEVALDDQTIQGFEAIVAQYSTLLERAQVLGTYVRCLVSTNSYDNQAQAKLSELQQKSLRLSVLGKRLASWLGSLDVEQLLARSAVARDNAYFLQRAKVEAAHLMSPEEEILAGELGLSGGNAWARLHGNVTSQLSVEIELDGQKRDLPMSMIRNLASERDRETRRKAYEAELAGWQRVAVPLAAAMNGIKGEVNVVTHHRKWSSPLDRALFNNSIDQEILDAMLGAARESFPDFRRYLRAKARALKLSILTWYDIFAPVGANERAWTYEEACDFIIEQFGSYSQRLADFAAHAFQQNWIDAEPRPGKRDGAFCVDFLKGESRVFTNYRESFNGVSTLAHELGHGYHNLNLAPRNELQRTLPMTLAETASTFCETIIRNAALSKADKQEQFAILEAALQSTCQVVVDISSRFLFEHRLFEKRQQRELSVAELNELMLEAQRETYGDGLDQDVLHPYMWAMKPHYYNTGSLFYNFPYMFGLLFGLGLYARYQQDPQTFKQGYDDLLSSTGMYDAATLSARFGIDLRSPDFWRASLDIIRADIERFEKLVAEG